MSHIAGLDGGSVSVKLAVVNAQGELVSVRYVRHRGRPLEAAHELLTEALAKWPELAVVATGSTGKLAARRIDAPVVNELAACAQAVRALHPEVRTIVEMGGEDAKLILLDEKGIKDFALNSVCAAGTGSFLDQQAERMLLSIEEFAELSQTATSVPAIAGRCSVFAKSDMIHLQQIATPVADIAAGLSFAVARNFLGAIVRGRRVAPPVAFMGGVALNGGVVRAFQAVLGDALGQDGLGELVIPEHAACMPAVGAALKGLAESSAKPLSREALEGLCFVSDQAAEGREPLATEDDDFRFRHLNRGEDPVQPPEPSKRTEAWLGVDIGSISTNLAVIDREGRLLAKRYLRTSSRPIEAVQQGLSELAEELDDRLDILGVGTTGSGRYMIADFIKADVVKNEITAQATAAAFIDPEVDTIFEIGGQDSKYISLKGGIIADFEMNKACAAGTGSFLEEQAEKLDVSVKGEFSELALGAKAPCRLGERCTVFMENSLMSELMQGARKPDLLAGLAYSIVENYVNRVVAGRPIGEKIFFQGGTAFNKSVAAAFEKYLGKPIVIPPHHDVTGAIGMALIARDHMTAHPELKTAFKGLSKERVPYSVQSFECRSCDNRCEINRVTIEVADEAGRKERLFYGGRCEKYDVRRKPGRQVEDLFAFREAELGRFHAERAAAFAAAGQPAPRGRIGLPRVFFLHDFLPFFSTLLWELGFEPELSPPTNRRIAHLGSSLVLSDACFPVKAAHGHVKALLDDGLRTLFIPSFVNLSEPETVYPAGQPCPLTQSFPYQAAVAFETASESPESQDVRFAAPLIDFRRGPDNLALEIERGLRPFGVALPEVRRALDKALAAQAVFRQTVRDKGREVLADLSARGERALTVIGRPYNAFDMGMNLEIPRKLATLGVQSVPMDMLPGQSDYDDLFADWPGMYWRSGQRLLKAARAVRDLPFLYPLFIGNFSCGPDSFIQKFLDKELAGKPCLHVEIDEHSADAGVITRCEAFLDSIDMRLMRARASGAAAPTAPDDASDRTERRAGVRAMASGNGQVRRRVVYIPPMCDHSEALAAAFRASGVESRTLPETDAESAALGRKHCSGKECYPFAVTTGDMLRKVLAPDFEPDKSAFFMPGGEGPCRFGQYNLAQRLVLDDLGFPDVPIFSPQQDETLYRQVGMVGNLFARRSWEGIVAFDLLNKCLHKTRPYERLKGSADELHGLYMDKLARALERPGPGAVQGVEATLAEMRQDFEHLPRFSGEKPIIGVVGEIYVRSNRFANENLVRRVEELGGEVRLAPIDEWIYYVNRLSIMDSLRDGQFKAWAGLALRDHVQRRIAKRFERLFEGFLEDIHEPSAAEVMAAAAPYVPESFRGEAILSVGKALLMLSGGAKGVINAMPFGCMPGTVVSGMLRGVSRRTGAPSISVAFDGSASSVTALQIEAFMEQAGAC